MTPADAFVYDAWARGIAPPTRLQVAEWAARERMLAGVGASEPGLWRNERTPYLVEIMNRLSPSDPCRVVVIKAGAQVGKTETGLNWAGYVVAHAPAPMLMVQPTEGMAKAFVAQRLEPMIDATPSVRALVTRTRAKEDGSSQFLKRFPGGMIKMGWANSPASLRSMPAADLFFDEVDAETDESSEGDFIDLGLARSRTFPRRKGLITSTPGIMRVSRVERWHRKGDQRVYKMPCPHCNARQHFEQSGLMWDRDEDGYPEPGSVRYMCEACGTLIEESWKAKMLPEGIWTPTAKGDPHVHSYWLPSFYSPLGWLGWEEIARMHAAAFRDMRENRDPRKMQVYVNTIEGRGWEDSEESEASDWSAVAARADDYAQGIVPASVLLLTAGVDTQDDRFEVSVYGWGLGEESWLITHEVILGDPDDEEVRERLGEFLLTKWPTYDGREMPITSSAIDSGGHRTEPVKSIARKLARWNVAAIRGSPKADAPILSAPTKQDVNHKGARLKNGVLTWNVGVGRIKRILSRRLKIAEPGPGRIHTPAGMDEGFYQQLCAERLIARTERGKKKEEWVRVRPSQAAEAWDCAVYAYFAAIRVGMDRGRLERLAHERGIRPAHPPTQRTATPARAPAHHEPPPQPAEGPAVRTVASSTKKTPRKRVTRSSWIGR